MGILRLILITLVGIIAAMLYFGRDDGLPETLIGRTPPPPAEVVTPNAALDPVAEPEPVAEPAPEPAPPAPAPEVAADPAPAAPEVVQTPDPAPAPAVEPEPEPAPVVVEEATPPPAAAPEVVTPAPEPEPADTVLYVTGTKVNVRTGPATVYEVVTSLEQGAAVVDLGDAGEGWRLVRLREGEIGYMSGDFLSPTAP